jgi:hypothetical protein
MQVCDQIAWSLPSLILRLLTRPSTPFSAGSRERPPSPNFPQLYIVEPSSGFNKGLRSTSLLRGAQRVIKSPMQISSTIQHSHQNQIPSNLKSFTSLAIIHLSPILVSIQSFYWSCFYVTWVLIKCHNITIVFKNLTISTLYVHIYIK